MPTEAPSHEDAPLWELIQTSWVVGRGFHAVFAKAGLSPGQFGTLALLAEQDALTQADLARRLMMRPQSVGELVGSLLQRGLITRTGPGGRGRRAGLTLTTTGSQTLHQVSPRVRAFEQPEAIGLTTTETTTLIRLLRTVRHTLNQRADVEPTPEGGR